MRLATSSAVWWSCHVPGSKIRGWSSPAISGRTLPALPISRSRSIRVTSQPIT
jgi:hypothetical protein